MPALSNKALRTTVMTCMLLAAAADAIAGENTSPGLFSGSLTTSVFTVVIFLVLMYVLGKAAWRPLLDGLRKREAMIKNDLESARAARLEAEKLLEEYQHQLAGIQKQAEQILQEARVEADRLRQEILAHAQQDARQVLAQAKEEIGLAKEVALREVYRQAVELASDMAAKVLQRDVNAEDQRILADEALEQLEILAGAGKET